MAIVQAHDLSDHDLSDEDQIDTHEDANVKLWMDKLGVSYEQLRQAVSNVGPEAHKVARYLNYTVEKH